MDHEKIGKIMPPQKLIFVSHAVKDKPLADAFVDLLETGIGISSNDVFCSSLEGLGIPAGKNFVDYIKDQIQEPKAVILLLTPNYYRSNFCLCELGATWAMCHDFFPILVPPLEYDEIKDVLTGVQLARIDKPSDLNEVQDRLKEILGIVGKKTARWEVKRNVFIEGLNQILSKIPNPQVISFSEHEKLQKKYKESIEEMEVYEKEISALKQVIEELKKCKDADQVQEILMKNSSELEIFQELINNAKTSLSPFPNIVVTAIYRYFTSETELVLNYLEDKYDIQSADNARDNGFLIKDANNTIYSLNLNDPLIKKTITLLEKLHDFIKEMSADLHGKLEKEANCEISLSNKRFWSHYIREI